MDKPGHLSGEIMVGLVADVNERKRLEKVLIQRTEEK